MATTTKQVNPLRVDPTRTTMLRKAFMADMARRFRALRGAVWELVYTEDAFGLRADAKAARSGSSGMAESPTLRIFAAQGIYNAAEQVIGPQTREKGTFPHTAPFTANAERFRFKTDADKVDAYRGWLKQQVDDKILSVGPGGDTEKPWTEPYISSAYKKGVLRAYTDKHVGTAATETLPFVEGGQKAFLDMSFNAPVGQNKLKLLSTRAFTELKGITAAMDQQMSRVLADGLANGHGAEVIARALNKEVDGIERKRARVIARTEVIRAHNEGQLDAFEAMNVEGVGVMAEWSTAHDGKVCPTCAPLEGVVLTIKEARGLLPRHPNCRCAWLPAGVGEHEGGTTKTTWAGPEQGLEPPGTLPTGKTTGQVWHKDDVAARILDSIKAEYPKLAAKEARAASRWAGADVTSVSKKIKPGSKAAIEAKKVEAATKMAAAAVVAAAKEVEKTVAREVLAVKKAERALQAKVDIVKKKYGLADDGIFTPVGATEPKLAFSGAEAYAKGRGLEELSPSTWDSALGLVEKHSGPGIPHLQAQMAALEEVVDAKLAVKKLADDAAAVAKQKAKEAGAPLEAWFKENFKEYSDKEIKSGVKQVLAARTLKEQKELLNKLMYGELDEWMADSTFPIEALLPVAAKVAGTARVAKAVEIPYKMGATESRMRYLAGVHEKGFVKAAKEIGVTVDEVKGMLVEAVQQKIDRSSIHIRAHENIISKILDDGRFKSSFEGTRPYFHEDDVRVLIDAEFSVLGVPKDIAADMRPIYSYLADGPSTKEFGEEYIYGDVIFKLKESVRDRATVTMGNSLLREEKMGAFPLNKKIVADNIDPTNIDAAVVLDKKAFLQEGVFDHTEAQIHGGVSMLDVDELYVPEGSKYLPAILESAKKHDIKVVTYKKGK